MEELERTWSFEDALNAHAVLDVLEAAEAEAHARAEEAAAKKPKGEPHGR
jgi:hypothetical protein